MGWNTFCSSRRGGRKLITTSGKNKAAHPVATVSHTVVKDSAADGTRERHAQLPSTTFDWCPKIRVQPAQQVGSQGEQVW